MSNLARAVGVLALVLWVVVGIAQAKVIYVNAGLSDGGDDGTSWSDAFRGRLGLQSALANAASGDEIWIAQGEYAPAPAGGSQEAAFVVPDGVSLLGGFAGDEASADQRDPARHAAVLTGDLNSNDAPWKNGAFLNVIDNSRHVVRLVNAGPATVLDGLTIRRGDANDSIGAIEDTGGNVHIVGGAPTLRRCIIEQGLASWGGGGLACIDASPRIEDCMFRENRGESFGGGMAAYDASAPVLIRTRFEGNFGGSGCGLYIGPLFLFSGGPGGTATLEHCEFVANQGVIGATAGGGIVVFNGSMNAKACSFHANMANGGGGVFVNASQATLHRCDFVANQSAGDGGGAFYVIGTGEPREAPTALCTAYNCRINGNSDAGLSLLGAETRYINCSIMHSTVGASPTPGVHTFFTDESSALTLRNSIVWGSASPTLEDIFLDFGDAAYTVDRCVIQHWDGSMPGDAVNADPLFTDALGADLTPGTVDDDLTLSRGSPAIDAGDNAWLEGEPEALDAAGSPRFVDDPASADTGTGEGPIVDLGAFEFQVCSGDATGDGVVDFADLNLVLSAWASAVMPFTGGDETGDGVVNFADLNAVLSAWGVKCDG